MACDRGWDERVSRRDVLRSTATAAGALAAGVVPIGPLRAAQQRAEPAERESDSKHDPAKGFVDAHVHVWTPDTERYPLSGGYRREEMRPPSFAPEELWQHARPCGVARVVLVQMSFYGFDNAYMLDCIAAARGRFSGIAVIDDGAAAPNDEMRRLAARGVRGFRIYPRNLPVDRWLDGEGMQAMWRTGAAERLAMCCLINPDALTVVDRMCGQHPETPVVIDHMARIGMAGPMREQDVAALCRLARHKQTYVKVSAFYALGKKQAPYTDLGPLVRRLVEAFGPRRLMWGSDCPYQVQEGHTYRNSIELVRSRLDFLSDEERAGLLGNMAAGLFFA